jgi:hypothetical protein
VKARPSGEKRRKEMLRQERNRDKEEKRKQRRLKPSTPGEPGEMADADPPHAAANEAVVAREGSAQELGDAAASSGSSARVSVP